MTTDVVEQLRWYKFPCLDDGFVCLVDVMGDDAAVVQAARLSYGRDLRADDLSLGSESKDLLKKLREQYPGGPDADVPSEELYVICGSGPWAQYQIANSTKSLISERRAEDEKLLRYLMRHRHCYAPWMQVLTILGWKRWDECGGIETFLVPDPETRALKAEVLSVESFYADDGLHTFENERMSYAVTPDHRMFFKGKYQDEFAIVRVQDMPKWGHFDPIRGYSLGDSANSFVVDKKAAFIAFWLGDGSFASTNRISFHLRKTRKKDYLESLIVSLGLECTREKSSTYEDAIVYWIVPPDWFRDCLGDALDARSFEKRLPLSSWRMASASWRAGIIEGLSQSDCHDRQDRDQIQLSSSSADVLLLWDAVNAASGIDAHRGRVVDGVGVSTAFLGGRTTLEARKQHFGFQSYSGMVYCATTSTGLLVVRGAPDKFAFVCGNTTPFEMAEVKLLIRIPMDAWRQMVRHRTANINEYSTRYTTAIDAMAETAPGEWRLQSQSNKQGSRAGELVWPDGYELWPMADDGGLLLYYGHKQLESPGEWDTHVGWALIEHNADPDTGNEDAPTRLYEFKKLRRNEITPGLYLSLKEKDSHTSVRDYYQERLRFGVAREQARKDLPLSNYTEVYWKCDLHNILHFLGLRMDSHAQLEIRQYATTIGEQIIRPLFPKTWEAFRDYRLEAMTLSRLEVAAVRFLQDERLKNQDWRSMFLDKREREECEAKLKLLGLL